MTLRKLAFIALANLFVFTSCTDDNDDIYVTPRGDYENGLLISHEGNFFGGNASVSYVSGDLNTVENNVFENVNGSLLGDTAQSMAFNGDFAYIIVNVSNKIEVVNRYTFVSVATINTGINNPRYMTFANGKGYVSNWGDGSVASDDYIAEIDLTTNLVVSTISVTEGPEQIVAQNNTIYVSHKGGFNSNNKVSVIDALNTNSVIEVTVNDNPDELAFDVSGNLYVLSEGQTLYDSNWNVIGHTLGAISKINTVTNTFESSIEFANEAHPTQFNIEGSKAYYYLNGSVYSMDLSDTTLPTTATISDLSFYDMTVKNGLILGVDAKDFASNGELQVYNATSGSLLNTVEVGIIPGEIYFN